MFGLSCVALPGSLANLLRGRVRANDVAIPSSPSRVEEVAPVFPENSKSCWLTSNISVEERISKAQEMMCKNAKGMMWVKVRIDESKTIMIPIKWKRSSVPAIQQSAEVDHADTRITSDVASTNPKVIDLSGNAAHSEESDIFALGEGDQSPTPATAHEEPESCDDDMCVICMEERANFQLMPCAHRSFCRKCILQTLCCWTKPMAPTCPLCRTPFSTMVHMQ
mmetsp:Transcript_81568/g.219231  ORF Transcript_81568/g.219231 Transcript_81568/m.219231 type:complete len:223 (+) Transcript_81568:116-784(+)